MKKFDKIFQKVANECDLLFESEHELRSVVEYNNRYLMHEVFADYDEQNLISENDYDIINVDVEAFTKSLKASKRGAFLSDYSDDEFSKFKLYLIDGHNAGFALKSDGDIVSVHNNSKLKGLGKFLILNAIKLGGKKLDHFDGFLTNFYSSLGFKPYKILEWDDQYAPLKWKFEEVDITKSIYKNLEVGDSIFGVKFDDKKIKQYKSGRPDVIFQKLK